MEGEDRDPASRLCWRVRMIWRDYWGASMSVGPDDADEGDGCRGGWFEDAPSVGEVRGGVRGRRD